MPRPRTHDLDAVLDTARDLALSDGARAATVAAIARASGASSGSLYHAFGSRDAVLVAVWARAARRAQDPWIEALESGGDAVDAGVAAALSVLAFARDEPQDARLLHAMRPADLLDRRDALDREAINAPAAAALRRYARRLGGPGAAERAALGTLDLPLGAIRRPLAAGAAPPRALDGPLAAAVRAVLTYEGGSR